MRISVKTNLDQFAKALTDLERRQLPYAVRRTVTGTARAVALDMRKEMETVFDRPTPFTLNAVYAGKADGTGAGAAYSSKVALRDYAAKGTPADRYLGPEIAGGTRGEKRFERRLAASTLAGAGVQVIPARGALLDQYGNVSRTQIGQILGHLRAFGDTGQNVSERKLRRLRRLKLTTKTAVGEAKYFIARSKRTGQPLGIWNLLGRGVVVPVFFFARSAPTYSPRFDFYGIANRSAQFHFPVLLQKWLKHAVATAK